MVFVSRRKCFNQEEIFTWLCYGVNGFCVNQEEIFTWLCYGVNGVCVNQEEIFTWLCYGANGVCVKKKLLIFLGFLCLFAFPALEMLQSPGVLPVCKC